MTKIHNEDKCNDTYGRERMYIALKLKSQAGEISVHIQSESTVRKVMEHIGLIHEPHRKPNRITKADREPRKSDDLLKRDFSADKPLEKAVTDIRTAEMTKVVENTFRDINIAFANELLKICRSDGLDVHEIIRIANKHPRVNILSPGSGVGGHCISVDPWFLVGDYPELAKLIRTARLTNDGMPDYVLKRANEIAKQNGIAGDRIGFYGITYKEDVDDVRDSPTLQLIKKMNEHLAGAPKCYDPMVSRQVSENQYQDFDQFLSEIDLMVIMVKHSHLKENAGKISNKVIFDTRCCAEYLENLNKIYEL